MASNRVNLQNVLNAAARKAILRRSTRVLTKAKSLSSSAEAATLGYAVQGNSYQDMKSKVGSSDPKFIFYEEGVKPHVIYPKNGKTLVFPGIGGKKTHSTVVFHPGVQGKHPLKRAARSK